MYPSFGTSAWSWNDDSNTSGAKEAVRDFYNTWLSFSTAKDFAWKELWNVSEAPDRRVRRCIEIISLRCADPRY